ncbi:hypothetical protein F4780DRAFT_792262 [Xylariomycetidae sp. FL0641]|nr:hypothetical protein F4780DRAFT_792262 [Xylariomycetidae sp. FL0641]
MGVSTTAATTGFQFITSINTVARDDETRRKVRSHARRQKLSPSGSATASQQTRKSGGTQKDRTSKFRLKSAPTAAAACSKSKAVVKVQRVMEVEDAEAEDEEKKKKKETEKGKKPQFETSMVTRELALTVARELPTFSMLRIETTPLTENLLKYCLTVCLSPRETAVQKWFDRAGAPTYMTTYYTGFLANAFAMNPDGDFFQSMQVDAAASHAFLAMVAAMHNSLANWHDTSTFDFHRFQAIRSVNERLNLEGKNGDMPVSDGVIMAVSLLVNNETYTGFLPTAAAHMNGLKRMVDLRGGLVEGFQYSTLLQRAIAWADFSYATTAQRALMFPFVPQLASSLPLHDRFTSRSAALNAAAAASSPKPLLTIRNRAAVADVLELLHAISACLNRFRDPTDLAAMAASRDRVRVSDSIYLVEYRLCRLEEEERRRRRRRPHDPSSAAPLSTTTTTTPPPSREQEEGDTTTATAADLSTALLYAAHLYLHLALRGQPPAAPRHRALAAALRAAVTPLLLSHAPLPSSSTAAAEAPGADGLHADILLWALFMGACVRSPSTTGTPTRAFFVAGLRALCAARGGGAGLAARLRGVLWLDAWCEGQVELVGREMAAAT